MSSRDRGAGAPRPVLRMTLSLAVTGERAALAAVGGRTGYIDQMGKFVVNPQNRNPKPLSLTRNAPCSVFNALRVAFGVIPDDIRRTVEIGREQNPHFARRVKKVRLDRSQTSAENIGDFL